MAIDVAKLMQIFDNAGITVKNHSLKDSQLVLELNYPNDEVAARFRYSAAVKGAEVTTMWRAENTAVFSLAFRDKIRIFFLDENELRKTLNAIFDKYNELAG
jgi:hypothetical protein